MSLHLINGSNWGLAPTKVFFSGYSVERIFEGIFPKNHEKVVQIVQTFHPMWAFNLFYNKKENSTRIFIRLNNVPCRTMALKQTIWRTWFSSCEGRPTICKTTSAAVGKVPAMMEIPLASPPMNSLLLSWSLLVLLKPCLRGWTGKNKMVIVSFAALINCFSL